MSVSAGATAVAGCRALGGSQPTPADDGSATPAETASGENGRTDSQQSPATGTTAPGTVTSDEPSVRNVLDYGASGDGTADDTAAVQRAFDDAVEGGTVYLPAGTYRVSAKQSSDPVALRLNGDYHPEDLTVEGDGKETTILMDGGHEGVHIALFVSVGHGYEGLHLRGVTVDGNRKAQNGKLARQVGNGVVVRGATGQSVGNVDVLVENVRAVKANMNGFRVLTGGVTMDRVSAVDNGRHGFALNSSLDVRSDDPVTVRNAYATKNGVENGNGHGFDLSGGTLVLENTISEGNHQGTKTTEEVFDATYRRVLLADNVKHGYIRPGNPSETGERATVRMDDVVAAANGSSGFRFGRDTDYTVGSLVARANGEEFEMPNIRVRDNASVVAETVFSIHGAGGAGINYGSTAESSIDSYVHYGNAGGGLEVWKGPIDIETSRDVTDPDFDHGRPNGVDGVLPDLDQVQVPAPGDVGVGWE